MKYYALRNKKTKELLGYSVSSNGEADFCAEVSIVLETNTGFYPVWLAVSYHEAEEAMNAGDDWYLDVRNRFSSDDLEIVEVEVVLREEKSDDRTII